MSRTQLGSYVLNICLILILLTPQLLTLADINIDKHSRFFIDIKGRVRIFHGVNIVVKNPPYVPIEENFDPLFSLNEEDYDFMVKFGFNVVRLGLIWEAVETSPGVYDMDYLNTYEKIINKLGERGIYTILDSHQDMFSRVLCGEGVPVFYAKDLLYRSACEENYLEKLFNMFGVCTSLKSRGIPVDESGIPLTDECKKHSFVEFHSSIELATIYYSFFENANNIQDRFVDYWKVLAQKFKGNKYIIGYDIWNEPWVGNLFFDVNHLVPGYFTNKYFLQFYKKVDQSLREVDNEAVSMFEEAIFPDTLPLMGGFYLGGYTTTPAGDKYLHKQVWSKHYYCKGLSAEVSRMRLIPAEISKKDCYPFAEYTIRKSKEKADELGVPVFITEFGACEEGESCYHEIKGLADACDRYHLSWAYWAYKPYGDHTTHTDNDVEGIWNRDYSKQNLKLKALTRPYIMAYQGTPIKSFFYDDLNLFHSNFVVNLDIDDFTLLYVNRDIYYPQDGFKVIFISHEINQHLLTQSKFKLITADEIVTNKKDRELGRNWEELHQSKGNYLKFKLESTNLGERKSKIIKHEYLGFRNILENTLELILGPKINYDVKKLKKIDQDNSNFYIQIEIEDMSPLGVVIGKERVGNLLIVENLTNNLSNSNLEIFIDYKKFEHLDDHSSVIELIKPIQINKEIFFNQLYIPKMLINIYNENTLLFEINIQNILNHHIKVQIN